MGNNIKHQLSEVSASLGSMSSIHVSSKYKVNEDKQAKSGHKTPKDKQNDKSHESTAVNGVSASVGNSAASPRLSSRPTSSSCNRSITTPGRANKSSKRRQAPFATSHLRSMQIVELSLPAK